MSAKKHRHSRPVNRTPKLILEALEPRIAPTVVAAGGSLSWTDSNGDAITVEYDGPAGSQVDVLDTAGGAIANGDNIGSIEITGSDELSVLSIWNDASGPGDTPIGGNGGIFTTGAEDLGALMLNVAPTWDSTGPVTFTAGEGITIGGELRTLAMSGPIDFDTGANFIWVGGDLGFAWFGDDVVLNSVTGEAAITAGGAGGLGDIGVMMVDGDILDSTGGSDVAPQAMAGTTPLTIADDVGDGTAGSLRLQLSGPAGAANVWAVPVPGGGSVLAWVELLGEGTGLTVTAQRAGGDVGWVWGSELAFGNIQFSGAADTDVGQVDNSGGDIGTVANRTAGGDFLWLWADADLEAVTTLNTGKIGALYRGVGSDPIVVEVLWGAVDVGGDLGLLSTGSLCNADVWVDGDLGTLRAGTIMHADLEVDGNAGLIRSDLVFASDLWIDGVLEQMQLGRGGMLDSDLQAVGGIGTFSSAGAVVSSDIDSLYDTGTGLIGGMIQELRAPEMHDVEVNALSGFGSVVVRGVVSHTEFDAWHYDPDLMMDVGGGIERFQVGGMTDESALDIMLDAGQVLIGPGGVTNNSGIDIGGNLDTFENQGDMSDYSSLGVGYGDVGTLIVRGSLIDNSNIDIEEGDAERIQIGGDVHESFIYVDGYAEQILVRGDLIDGLSEIEVGSAGRIQVGAVNSSEGIHVDGDVELVQVGNAVGPEDGDGYGGIDIEGSAGTIRVASSLVHVGIFVDGDVEQLQVNGSVLEDSLIDIDGNAARIDIRRDLSDDSEVTVEGDLAVLNIGGSVSGAEIDLEGSVTGDITIGGDLFDSGVYVDGDLDALVVQGSVRDSRIDVDGSVTGDITVKGSMAVSDLHVEGGLDALVVGGSVVRSTIDVDGEVEDGFTGSITVGGDLQDANLWIDQDLSVLVVRGSIIDSRIDVDGSVTGDVTIGRDFADSELEVGGDLDLLRIGGALQGSSIDVDGEATEIVIHEWLWDEGVYVGGTLESLVVQTPMESGSESLYVEGDLTSASFQGITELYAYVGGSVGEFMVSGPTEDLYLEVQGDLTTFAVRGSVSETDLDVDGNADTIQVVGAAQEFEVDIDGLLNTFLVRGSLVYYGDEGGILAQGGINSFTVTELLANYIVSTTAYDGSGNPVGGGIGTFQVGEMRDVDVNTHMDIGEFVVQGAVTDSDIQTTAYDDYGTGDLVGGGGINSFQALGLYNADVETYGSITEMLIGRGGIDSYSDVAILGGAGFGGGNLVKLQTPGFIFGEIYVTGNVVDILTGGADALPGSAPVDFFFVDNHSFPTGGELEVEGAILGTIS